MSIAGGLSQAVARAVAVGADALQIFTRNQRQWRVPPMLPAEATAFRAAATCAGLRFVCAHDSYLTNLASPDATVRERSVQTLVAELKRAAMLGCTCVVLHPGSPQADGVAAGIRRLVCGISQVLEATVEPAVMLALENTAGQGSALGADFGQLGEVLRRLDRHPRLGFCLDTCHAFAAGYDLRTAAAIDSLAREIDHTVGLDRLLLLHLNDSLRPLGSRVDRHAHVGQGALGAAAFRCLLRSPWFDGVPGIIETPKDDETLAEDRANLERLRRFEQPGRAPHSCNGSGSARGRR